MVQQAKYSLAEVFKLIEIFLKDGKETVWFSAPSKSIHAVIKLYPEMSEEAAQKFILEGMKQLTDKHFMGSNIQWGDPNCVADTYGLLYAGKPWFVKFLITEGAMEEISFHPPEKDMKTVGGIIIRTGEKPWNKLYVVEIVAARWKGN